MSTEPNEQGHLSPVVDDTEKCIGCALCCQMCPDVVIEIEK